MDTPDEIKKFFDSFQILSLPSSISMAEIPTHATIRIFVHEKYQCIAAHSSGGHLLEQVESPIIEKKHNIPNFPATCSSSIDALVSDLLTSCITFYNPDCNDELHGELSTVTKQCADYARTGNSRPAYIEIVADIHVVTQYVYRFSEEEVGLVLRETDSCSICLEKLLLTLQVAEMRCSHKFHESCIFEWLRVQNTCPLCRTQLLDD